MFVMLRWFWHPWPVLALEAVLVSGAGHGPGNKCRGTLARAGCRKSATRLIRSCRAKSRHPSVLRHPDGCLDFARHERDDGSDLRLDALMTRTSFPLY